MSAISASLALNDRMSSVLKRINKAMGIVLDSFEAVQKASGQSFNSAALSEARKEMGRANQELNEMAEQYQKINRQQNELNKGLNSGASASNGLLKKIKGVAAAYVGIKQGASFVKNSLSMLNTQTNAETQLKTVLGNMGSRSGAYDALKQQAGALQSKTSFGDEVLLGGAAEFATYMSDDAAISKMMETLTNYAAGMSGGGEVGYEEMVNYATGLGKVMTGSYDAMTKKGFEFSDQQKQIIENGTDMEKALVISDVINESWDGLAERMANTPEGRIIQLKNAIGDMREELAARIYPAVMQLFDAIGANGGNIGNVITALAGPINLVLSLTTKLLNGLSAVFTFANKHWSKLGPIIYGIAGALALYNAVLLLHKAYLIGASVAQGIKTASEYRHAKATLASAEAAGVNTGALTGEALAAAAAKAGLDGEATAKAKATVAQTAFNTALLACPLTWIIALVIALIVVFVAFTEQIVGAIWWVGALFKNIGLWCANVGLAIWNAIKNVGLWLANLGQAIWAIIKNVGYWFANLGMGIWGVIKAAANNVGVAFHNAWVSIQIGFWTMVDVLMQGLKFLAEKANKYLGWLGVDIDTSGLDFAAEKLEALSDQKQDYASIGDAWNEGFNTFAYDSVSDAFHSNYVDWGEIGEGYNTFDVFQNGWGSEAYNSGAEIGAGIHDWISDNLSLDSLMGVENSGLDDFGLEDPIGYGDELEGIEDNTEKSAEELSYLRDIAEKEAINRFTTAEIKVDMSGMTNRIDSDMDLDGVISYLTNGVAEALATAGEGVY